MLRDVRPETLGKDAGTSQTDVTKTAHAQPRCVELHELQPVRRHRPIVQGRKTAAIGRHSGDRIAGAECVIIAPPADRLYASAKSGSVAS